MISKQQVLEVVEREIKPMLLMEGGSIEVVDVNEKDGIVQVRLLGACGTCPMSLITLTAFVERTLRSKIPDLKKVVPV
ncbi:MAG: NifU family protein [Archaeoglobi archaeon]|jgi:Fe-S cluster biogenesis protein NfuA|nr:MAG: NifU family protein [Archaeoglobi archaeon]TDA25612.1 MAG: NifU family protein [Archaeoglobi archaeon]TDA30294.1 MAG: NifU family protein [Archaeoglobi archaeon]